jgi:hypothetical protein
MKIVSLIASYSPSNQYVGKVIDELNKYSSVILFTTEPHNYNVKETIYFDKSIVDNLVYEPRKWIINNLESDWDYVLYNEDDILIPERSFYTVIDLYSKLPNHLVPGFARCEVLDDNIERYIDLHPKHSVHRGGSTIIKTKFSEFNVWEPFNLHSGNYLFSKSHIRELILRGELATSFQEFSTYGLLETAASSLYNTLHKVIDKNISSVNCYHLPNKYIPLQGGPTEDDIIKEYKQIK